MNNVFTVKFLQNLRNKKGGKGFTLIELLVVVIIIGVLAAVALPNLLGQVAKGRQSEAKNNLGAVNRAQQAHRLEEGLFGVIQTANAVSGIELLPVRITGDNYTYQDAVTAPTAVSGGQQATAAAAFEDDIVDYTAAVNQQSDGDFVGIICESDAVNGATGPIAAGAGTATAAPTCGGGSTQL